MRSPENRGCRKDDLKEVPEDHEKEQGDGKRKADQKKRATFSSGPHEPAEERGGGK
jgi:hypothetical protein